MEQKTFTIFAGSKKDFKERFPDKESLRLAILKEIWKRRQRGKK